MAFNLNNVTMIASNTELQIFQNFEIDYLLPKHKTKELVSYNTTVSGNLPSNGSRWQNMSFIDGENIDRSITIDVRKHMHDQNPTFMSWLKLKAFIWSSRIYKEKNPVKPITIKDYFNEFKTNIEKLNHVDDIATHYEAILQKAISLNQTALVEKLQDMIEVVRAETYLINTDLNKFITEKNVCDLYKKVGKNKNLKLTWLKNFTRVIPDIVFDAKKIADEKLVFDNYVILHYDLIDNGESLTKEEIEKKKEPDPILFGVIKNSRKLYYIADWIDDYCDLTLEQMVIILGSKVGEINNKSVKTFIEKIKA